MRIIASLIILFGFVQCLFAQGPGDAGLNIKYTIPENDLIPEGIAYDPVEKSIYISSTYKRKIIKVNRKGQATDFIKEGQDGILGVVGMRVDAKRRFLWAASGDIGMGMPIKNSDSAQWGFSGLYKYHLRSGKLADKYLLHQPGSRFFLNDLVLDSKGTPYITDTRAGKIYTINGNTNSLEVFMDLPTGHLPNGIDITPDGKYLFVAMYASPQAIYGRIDIMARKLELLEMNGQPAGADGLYYFRNSLVAILPGHPEHKIVQYTLDDGLLMIKDMKALIKNDTLLSQPTTGVIAGNKFYFIATGNLQLFAKLFRETNGKVNPKDLPPIRIGELILED